MVLVSFYSRMGLNILVRLITILLMEMENIFILMAVYTKENSKKACNMALDAYQTKMGKLSYSAIGLTVISLVM